MDADKLRWLGGLLPRNLLEGVEDGRGGFRFVAKPSAEMCLRCRASKMLCGRPRCPILVSASQLARGVHAFENVGQSFSGVSPPGVFVGRMGYPKVYAGPLVAAQRDPWIVDLPEAWLGLSVDTIVGFRFSLLRGMGTMGVSEASKPSRRLLEMHELVLSSRPVDTELELGGPLRMVFALSDEVEPMGPSAPYVELKVGGSSSDRRLEKVYYDADLGAWDAVVGLYSEGVEVSRIQKALSVGLLGVRAKRRLVPTRWSITAVDTILSESLIERVRRLKEVGETHVYVLDNLGSTYVGFVFPGEWAYEWVEAWQPKTTWNMGDSGVELTGDMEDWRGRTTYAEPGGCYYAARLAAAEGLLSLGRKGVVVLLREIHSGYMMPLGVWSVREAVRALFKQRPERFREPWEAVAHGLSKTSVPLAQWLTKARLLDQVLHQRRLSEFLGDPR